jgi:hypothetical protein
MKKFEHQRQDMEREIVELNAENERLRSEKRVICDKFKALCEEKDTFLQKLT